MSGSKERTITEWLEQFKQGAFDSPKRSVQVDAGWYDWFCKEESLHRKTKKLGKMLEQISKSPKIKPDKQYVFFKNNCPMVGKLYDDFRICDITSGEVIYTITPASGHRAHKGIGSVWGKENSFSEPLFEGSWRDIKKWFNK